MTAFLSLPVNLSQVICRRMLRPSWHHSICRPATTLLRIFHKRTGLPGKTQHSFKPTSSYSLNLRRDLTQSLLKSGFFCHQTIEVCEVGFLLPMSVFKLLCGHARIKKYGCRMPISQKIEKLKHIHELYSGSIYK